EQVAGATADVEHAPGRRMHRQGELRRPVGDVMMQAAARALLVTEGSFVEGSDIAVRRHTGSLADQPAPRCGARRATSLPQVARRLPVSRSLTTDPERSFERGACLRTAARVAVRRIFAPARSRPHVT